MNQDLTTGYETVTLHSKKTENSLGIKFQASGKSSRKTDPAEFLI